MKTIKFLDHGNLELYSIPKESTFKILTRHNNLTNQYQHPKTKTLIVQMNTLTHISTVNSVYIRKITPCGGVRTYL